MQPGRHKKHALLSWLFVGALVLLSLALGVLQYGWIDELSRAEKERLQSTLHTSLLRVSRDFNGEVTAACTNLISFDLETDQQAREGQYAARFEQWKDTSRHNGLLRRVLVAEPAGSSLQLRELDQQTGNFHPVDWPAEWRTIQERLLAKLAGTEGPPFLGGVTGDLPDLFEMPVFDRRFARGPDGGRPRPRELEWIIVQFDLEYIRTVVIPALLQRDLPGGAADYLAAVTIRNSPKTFIYRSQTEESSNILANADASVNLFEVDRGRMQRGSGPGPPRNRGMRRGPPPENRNSDTGRWTLSVRHRAGSLEAVVAKAKARNLAVMAGIIALILATVLALVQFTRRAQRLAELQMEFVAGVSHELRTPLTVMRTAGHNLQGRVSGDPARVQRYGALIQSESQKLTAIVEQILSFSNMEAGRVIGERQPLQVSALVDEALAAERGAAINPNCHFERNIAPDLPPISADPTTLQLALQNLLTNAAKYGTGEWVGVSASLDSRESGGMVEVVVSDHGEGISADEIGKIFDPFYRGMKAVEDQVHGTGLGLSLAKRIVEAHGGTLSVRSEVDQGTHFIMRIPAAVSQSQHEFANSTN
ncbi:MAG TPA: HAMP domain-containing sensor histidine kinase [Bryobacteraceae bacterium]|nr:HAMP domain-containing sensor histidine kinase [Bryobacteraceae bacterium]